MAALQINMDYSCRFHKDSTNDKTIPSCVRLHKMNRIDRITRTMNIIDEVHVFVDNHLGKRWERTISNTTHFKDSGGKDTVKIEFQIDFDAFENARKYSTPNFNLNPLD